MLVRMFPDLIVYQVDDVLNVACSSCNSDLPYSHYIPIEARMFIPVTGQ